MSVDEIKRAKKLPFVSDVVLAANAELYHIWLRYDFANMMPTGKNYLTIDADQFTAERVIDAWDKVVVDFYRRQTERALQLSTLARQALTK